MLPVLPLALMITSITSIVAEIAKANELESQASELAPASETTQEQEPRQKEPSETVTNSESRRHHRTTACLFFPVEHSLMTEMSEKDGSVTSVDALVLDEAVKEFLQEERSAAGSVFSHHEPELERALERQSSESVNSSSRKSHHRMTACMFVPMAESEVTESLIISGSPTSVDAFVLDEAVKEYFLEACSDGSSLSDDESDWEPIHHEATPMGNDSESSRHHRAPACIFSTETFSIVESSPMTGSPAFVDAYVLDDAVKDFLLEEYSMGAHWSDDDSDRELPTVNE